MVESDEEQIEVLKNWWDENGTTLVVTLVVVLGGTFGYRAYEANVKQTGEAASAVYEDLIEASLNVGTGDADDPMVVTANSLKETLKADHGESTYAIFAAMHSAKLSVNSGDLETAKSELQWVLDQSPDTLLESIVRTRLARVLIGLDDASAAKQTLDAHQPSEGQLSSYEEVRGDALLALGDNAGAREAYQRAIEHLTEGVNKPILELKLADIPLTDGSVDLMEDPAAAPQNEDDA